MFNRFKSYAALIVTMLALCGFVMPLICESAHAASKNVSISSHADDGITFKNVDSDKDNNQDNSAFPDGCVGHHCCWAKLLVIPTVLLISFMQEVPVVMSGHVDQAISLFNINGLDRPPRNIA